jgi:hypothetical protein
MTFAVETTSLSNLRMGQPFLVQDMRTLIFAGDVLILGNDKKETEEKRNY